MKILVTGSQSFIGRNLIPALRAKGHEAIGLDQTEGADILCDIRSPNLSTALPQGLDCIVHLAAISNVKACEKEPRLAETVNVNGTTNIVGCAAAHGIKQVILASTEWVYPETAIGALQPENTIHRPSNVYARTKSDAEQRMRHGDTILRFSIIYGPRPTEWTAVESLVVKVVNGAPIEVGSLKTARRYLYIDDACAGIIAALGRPGTYNIAGPNLVSLKDIIEAAKTVSVFGPVVHPIETTPEKWSIRNADPTKAAKDIGWTAKVDIAEGVSRLLTGT